MSAPRDLIRVGLIGAGIQASRSPILHEQEAASQGLRLHYALFDLDECAEGAAALPELLAQAEHRGFAGVNVTHPCKQAVIAHLHELSGEARELGAVNTVVFAGGRRIGHNTDWWGFGEALGLGLPEARLGQVVQLGAGGAGRAAAYALLRRGAGRVLIRDIEASRAADLVAMLEVRFGAGRARTVADVAEALAQADGLVNATPVGMQSHPGMPLPAALLRPSLWVAEIIYFPLETALLRAARQLGCRTLDGGGMAVFQAAAAFELFTGQPADAARMLRRFRAQDAAQVRPAG